MSAAEPIALGIPRCWFWELAVKGDGPDYFAWVEVEESAPGQLEAFVRGIPLPGFQYLRVTPELCPSGKEDVPPAAPRSYDQYGDDAHFAQMARNIQGIDRENIWSYVSIEVGNGTLKIERGYGGDGLGNPLAETELLRSIAVSSLFPVRRWGIGAAGYAMGLRIEGRTGSELLTYLEGLPPA